MSGGCLHHQRGEVYLRSATIRRVGSAFTIRRVKGAFANSEGRRPPQPDEWSVVAWWWMATLLIVKVWKHLSVERWGPQGSVKCGDRRSPVSQFWGGHYIPDVEACGDEWALPGEDVASALSRDSDAGA
jgi:hypothetical protein